jgi:serine/threonine-protein kinase
MVSTELGACEWFVWDLRRSNLIERGSLDQIVGEFLSKNPRAEPPALAEYLVGRGTVTQFQADRLLQGKTQGFVLGPFTLMDSLGAGSMGTVYKAQNKTDNQWYAVKVLPRRSMWNVRIARRKVRAFEACRHPSVVPFVDVGTAGGMHYLAWQYVEGETLDKVVARQGKLAWEQTAAIGRQVAEGLDVCHRESLIHGLVKPSNLQLAADGQVHILDSGIGALLAETEGESLVDTMSTANSVTSGLDCASPESIMEPTNLTPAGDQYSLGCSLYYLLGGQYPFPDGSAADKMMAHQFKEPDALSALSPEVPAALVAVVEKLMAKSPEGRYASMAEVAEALHPFVKTTSVAPRKARPEPRPEPAAARPSRPVTMAAVPPRPAAPSSATPRPQASLGALPTRSTLRGAPAAPAPMPEPVEAQEEEAPKERVIPGAAAEPTKGWEERFGPAGITAAALALCGGVYFVAVYFQLL